jgi:hypothetical protein
LLTLRWRNEAGGLLSRSNANGAAALVDVLHFTGEGGGESIIGCVNVTSIAKDTTAMLQSVLRTFLEEESSNNFKKTKSTVNNYNYNMFLGQRHPTEQHEILDGIGAQSQPGGVYIHYPIKYFTDKKCTSLT